MTTDAIEAGARAAERIRDLISDLKAEHEATCDLPFEASAWKIDVSVTDLQALLAAGELVPASAVAANNRLAIARAICRSDHGPGVPSCVMDDHPERDPCDETNCLRFEQADAVIAALSPGPASGEFVVVPRVPTQAMLEAGEETFTSGYSGTPVSTPQAVWTAMLNAAAKDGERA